ncbi:MAG: DUF819 family protein [Planctomycetota bacterium]|nr:MAG: DUF819 family protein [Planctomycetota bacterium]
MAVLAILLGVLAVLFAADRHKSFGRIFRVIPLLVFCYFVPTILSNTGLIPMAGKFPLYSFTKYWLLPASLVLLILSVDVPAILGLGKPAVLLFLTATFSIVVGGPLAYALLGGFISTDLGDQAWKGLAALCGSWIGGGANFTAIGESVGTTDSTLSIMVVVDVAVANVWMAILLSFAGREKAMDAAIGADRTALEAVRKRVEDFQAEVARPTNLPDLLTMVSIAFGLTAIGWALTPYLPKGSVGDKGEPLVNDFTWVVILASAASLLLSFTPLRRLEGAGASKVGSVLLYLLVATIGAKADFSKVLDPKNTGLLVVGALWMCFHATFLLLVWRKLKAPIFFAAVGSKANVGGAASAPIVASAFHPALAPVGVLLAVAGYVLGIYGGLLSSWLLRLVYEWRFALPA